MAADLTIGGLTPFTTIDFPGHLAAVFFCQGCPWRCGYCHNPHLQPAVGGESWRWPALLDWLETRRGLLDGVVFSGGEPLLQRALPSALAQVRQRGFAIGLHTAGSNPRRLAAVLPLVDWVGFDVKAPFDDYARITGTDGGRLARASLEALLASGKPHEIRCTVDPGRLDLTAVERMVAQLAALGIGRLLLQPYRRDGTSIRIPNDWREVLHRFFPPGERERVGEGACVEETVVWSANPVDWSYGLG